MARETIEISAERKAELDTRFDLPGIRIPNGIQSSPVPVEVVETVCGENGVPVEHRRFFSNILEQRYCRHNAGFDDALVSQPNYERALLELKWVESKPCRV